MKKNRVQKCRNSDQGLSDSYRANRWATMPQRLGEGQEITHFSCHGFVAQWLERPCTNRENPGWFPTELRCLTQLSVLLALTWLVGQDGRQFQRFTQCELHQEETFCYLCRGERRDFCYVPLRTHPTSWTQYFSRNSKIPSKALLCSLPECITSS